MPLTITPTSAAGNFSNFTYDFILRSEALYKRVYTDGLGVPTLGVGYALAIEVGGVWQLRSTLDADLGAIGIALSPADRTRLNSAVAKLNLGDRNEPKGSETNCFWTASPRRDVARQLHDKMSLAGLDSQ